MNNMIFGKFVNNKSFLTKLDARFKLIIMLVLLVLCFFNFNIVSYISLFGLLIIITLIGKLNLRPLLNIIKHMWLLIIIVLVVNLFTITGEPLFKIGNFIVYKDAIFATVYIILRLMMILLISNLLTATTKPDELTYALEFYLVPLKIFKVNVNEIALMMSIALRFIPTLFEEIQRINKAQTSRGIDFKYGKYSEKFKAVTSVIIPLFVSCFEKADDLSEAMIVKGYGMGKRSKYKRFELTYRDLIALVFVSIGIVGIFLLNGVIL